ncbi:MAG: hypothetical protein LBR11_08825 [Deltaproteobacteria bacterium]|nr:hypothetical protein [Deltaproteobacteria bacterium]
MRAPPRDPTRRNPQPAKRPDVLGDRFWRLGAIFVLCFLVFYFSYDHGRASIRGRLEREMAENQALRTQLALLEREMELRPSPCVGGAEAASKAAAESAAESARPPGPVKFTTRVGEDRAFFGGRLILTVVEVNNLDREVTARLHYKDSAHRETTLVQVGQALVVNIDGQRQRFFLDQLKGSLAYFSLYENQPVSTSESPARPEPESASSPPARSEAQSGSATQSEPAAQSESPASSAEAPGEAGAGPAAPGSSSDSAGR